MEAPACIKRGQGRPRAEWWTKWVFEGENLFSAAMLSRGINALKIGLRKVFGGVERINVLKQGWGAQCAQHVCNKISSVSSGGTESKTAILFLMF